MGRELLLAGGIAAACCALPAASGALTLTNYDRAPQSVRVIDDQGHRMLVLKPYQRIRGLCPNGCTLRLAGGAEAEYFGPFSVVIAGGRLLVED